jgi:hypothetical protein
MTISWIDGCGFNDGWDVCIFRQTWHHPRALYRSENIHVNYQTFVIVQDSCYIAPSLGSSLLPKLGRVRVNIIGQVPWCEHLSVGETIDISMPKVGRVDISWTRYARPESVR